MKNSLITFQTAKLAKEKGFNETALYFYDIDDSSNFYTELKIFEDRRYGTTYNNTKFRYYAAASNQSDLQKWLRENYDVHVEVISHKYVIDELYFIKRSFSYKINEKYYSSKYNSYEKALEEGLIKGLKKLKNVTTKN